MFPPSHSNVKGRHYFSIFMVTRLTIYKCQNDNTIVMDSAYSPSAHPIVVLAFESVYRLLTFYHVWDFVLSTYDTYGKEVFAQVSSHSFKEKDVFTFLLFAAFRRHRDRRSCRSRVFRVSELEPVRFVDAIEAS